MAYLNNVAIAVREIDYEQLHNCAMKEDERIARFLARAVRMTERNGIYYAVLHWENIPWDKGKEEKFIQRILRENKLVYAFIRIGQEYDDIEWKIHDDNGIIHDDTFHELLSIHQYIISG